MGGWNFDVCLERSIVFKTSKVVGTMNAFSIKSAS